MMNLEENDSALEDAKEHFFDCCGSVKLPALVASSTSGSANRSEAILHGQNGIREEMRG
jgi:hypothetical protein